MRPLSDRAFLLLVLLPAVALATLASWAGRGIDLDCVLGNPATRDAGALARAFRDPHPPATPGTPLPTYAWRPVTEASFWLNLAVAERLGGGLLAWLRAGSLLLHAAAALAAFWAARELGRSLGIASGAFPRWAALFFALHPLGVQNLTYVYQRYVILEAALLFLTVGLYARARRTGSRRAWIAALGAGVLAMGAKETAVTLPLALAALEWILHGQEPGESARAALRRWLPFACLPLILLVQVLRAHALSRSLAHQGLFSDAAGLRPLEYLLLQLPILGRYLALDAWPFPLAFHFDRPAVSPPPIPAFLTAACGLLVAALLGFVLRGPAR